MAVFFLFFLITLFWAIGTVGWAVFHPIQAAMAAGGCVVTLFKWFVYLFVGLWVIHEIIQVGHQ